MAANSSFVAMVLLGAGLALGGCDRVEFDDSVAKPAFVETSPVVLFDESHHNHHKLGSTYEPFARLLRNDGFEVKPLKSAATPQALAGAQVFAIVTAQADTETNAEPAFTPTEIAAILDWVRGGGSLLLVSEHFPFANAIEGLANALDLDVAKGMTFDAVNHRRETGDDSRLLFSRDNGLLAPHPIIEGRNPSERVRIVETFTGDALRPRAAGTAPLLRLASTAVNRVGSPKVKHAGGDVVVDVEFGAPTSAAGWFQGVAMEMGKGRVVVLAEAAALTAQEDGGRQLGMNASGNDNRQFLLNTMRWLARAY